MLSLSRARCFANAAVVTLVLQPCAKGRRRADRRFRRELELRQQAPSQDLVIPDPLLWGRSVSTSIAKQPCSAFSQGRRFGLVAIVENHGAYDGKQGRSEDCRRCDIGSKSSKRPKSDIKISHSELWMRGFTHPARAGERVCTAAQGGKASDVAEVTGGRGGSGPALMSF